MRYAYRRIPQYLSDLNSGVKQLLRYLLRRCVDTIIGLFLIITVVFFLMHSIPGGPFAQEKRLPPEIEKNINERYHLNDPLLKQYMDYLKNLAKGDLGPSFKYQDQTVNDLIKNGFPVSATLGAIAVVFSLLIGCMAGIIAALNQNKWQDYIAIILAAVNFSVPSFIMAPLLMYVFALKLGWLPAAMWGTPQQVILPALALSAAPTAFIANLMRSSMLEVLQQDYIKTAKAKGLTERVIVYRHAVKNAILPVITYLGPLVAGILTGSFIIERIFVIPGLGEHFVTSISNRDYTVILGITIFYSAFLMIMNLLVDIAYVLINPRIKIIDIKEG